ncbi:MAG: PTS sugar transporter subunit IIA [Candidatus Aminicenantes bacterium]
MDSLTFGHVLRILRTTAGISLRTMAKRVHLSPAYLSQVELGKQPPPTHERMVKIAEIIGIPVSVLSEMSNRPNPEVMLLLQGHSELNKLIKSACDIGLEYRDILEIISLMQDLGRTGFRKFIHYGVNHTSNFKPPGNGNMPPEEAQKQTSQIEYSEFVNPRLVFTNLNFAEKDDLLRFLIDKAGSIYHSLNVNQVYDELMVHESETSSGLGNGLAVPHLFVHDLKRTILAIGRIPDGIDFDAIDKKPVYLVCVILSNPKEYRLHLYLLAFLARRLQHSSFIKNLTKAKSKTQIASLLFSNVPSSMN